MVDPGSGGRQEGGRQEGLASRVLLSSGPDTASQNIREEILKMSHWQETGSEFDGAPVLRLSDASSARPVLMAEIEDWHIRREGIGEQLEAVLGPLDAIMVLSRHRAASGKPSLTAHPVGNPGAKADAGGEPRQATPTHPHLLAAAYRALVAGAKASGLEHSVSLEATHHGPLTRVPLLFIEVGSSEEHWGDPRPGEVVAKAALEAVAHEAPAGTRTVIGIGGPHYAPRFGALLQETDVGLGHMVAAYHWTGDDAPPDREVIQRFVDASIPPGEEGIFGAYVDRKSLPGPARRQVIEDLESLDVPVVRTADLSR